MSDVSDVVVVASFWIDSNIADISGLDLIWERNSFISGLLSASKIMRMKIRNGTMS